MHECKTIGFDVYEWSDVPLVDILPEYTQVIRWSGEAQPQKHNW